LLKFGGERRRPRHMMIAHVLSARKKQMLFDHLRLASHIDLFLVYSTWQRHLIAERWKLPAERVKFTPFMVDSGFFSVQAVEPETAGAIPGVERDGRPLLCAVGLEFRDYPTLLAAVTGLDAQVVIAAASPWSRRADSTRGRPIPENVTVGRFSHRDLRGLYAASEFVLMPLHEIDFQAGVTALLEAMAMGRALVCTRTPGQTDVVVEGETGLYVPPGDPDAFRAAITSLLADPERRRRMGAAGRALVESRMDLKHYVKRLRALVDGVRRQDA
jgi:glycosyltransferase involved in cell wall biosynthesis